MRLLIATKLKSLKILEISIPYSFNLLLSLNEYHKICVNVGDFMLETIFDIDDRFSILVTYKTADHLKNVVTTYCLQHTSSTSMYLNNNLPDSSMLVIGIGDDSLSQILSSN